VTLLEVDLLAALKEVLEASRGDDQQNQLNRVIFPRREHDKGRICSSSCNRVGRT